MDRYTLTYWLKDPKEKVVLKYSDLEQFARDAEAFLRGHNQVLFSVPKYEPVAILKIQHVFATLGVRPFTHRDSDKSIDEYVKGVTSAAVTGLGAGAATGAVISLWHQGGPTAVLKYIDGTGANALAAFWHALGAVGSSASAGATAAVKTVTVVPDPYTVAAAATLAAACTGYRKFRKIRLSVRATVSPLDSSMWDFQTAAIPPSWGFGFGRFRFGFIH